MMFEIWLTYHWFYGSPWAGDCNANMKRHRNPGDIVLSLHGKKRRGLRQRLKENSIIFCKQSFYGVKAGLPGL